LNLFSFSFGNPIISTVMVVHVEKDYLYQGKTYHATITYKRMRNLRLRYEPDRGGFRVSVPFRTSMADIDRFIMKYLPRMVKTKQRKKNTYEDGYLYVFGKRVYVGEMEQNEIIPYYKRIGMPVIMDRVAYYARKMGVKKEHKVRLRDMRRTFGSNSRRTGALTFQTRLMAFPISIIDSVVVHELAHDFYFDHSKKFYGVVYKYCPNYDALRRALIHDGFDIEDHK